jgi:hypothetical protein
MRDFSNGLLWHAGARKRYLNQSLQLYGGEAAVQQTGVPFWEALS